MAKRAAIVSLLIVLAWTVSAAPERAPLQDAAAATANVQLPLQSKSVRFAVVGDTGTGEHEEYEIAGDLAAYRDKVGFDFVIMLGDNIYGGHKPKDFVQKFEQPFKPLLDQGVKFYASLGNHDDPNTERLYQPFNMGGSRYYTFKKGDVQFFALDSNYMDPEQLSWLERNLQQSKAKWKICFFHHPLFNDGKTHGPDLDLRKQLEPLFVRYGVNGVFSGHEHVYERVKPQDDIYYFIVGNSAKLVTHDFRSSEQTEKSFDTDRSFMLVEIAGDKLYFQTISRTRQTIDSGMLQRQPSTPVAATPSQ